MAKEKQLWVLKRTGLDYPDTLIGMYHNKNYANSIGKKIARMMGVDLEWYQIARVELREKEVMALK